MRGTHSKKLGKHLFRFPSNRIDAGTTVRPLKNTVRLAVEPVTSIASSFDRPRAQLGLSADVLHRRGVKSLARKAQERRMDDLLLSRFQMLFGYFRHTTINAHPDDTLITKRTLILSSLPPEPVNPLLQPIRIRE
jgi:hypothetical protein